MSDILSISDRREQIQMAQQLTKAGVPFLVVPLSCSEVIAPIALIAARQLEAIDKGIAMRVNGEKP